MFSVMFFQTNFEFITMNNLLKLRKNAYTVRDLPPWYGKIGSTFHGNCLYEPTLDTDIVTRSSI